MWNQLFKIAREIQFFKPKTEYDYNYDIKIVLDCLEMRKEIPHTKGEHKPKNNKLLCNGHCNWDKCSKYRTICNICGYIECWSCGEDWVISVNEMFPELEGFGFDFCRNCLNQDCIDDYLVEN